MKLSREFLEKMARAYELSPEQGEVFLLRFDKQKSYKEIASQLNAVKRVNTTPGAYLKRMGTVYEKFGISGNTRGKENKLRIFLEEQYFQCPGETPLTSVSPPQPSLPKFPGGPLKLNSPVYIERPPIETNCYQEIIKPGALIRIKAPRNMGKTSLMLRILHWAKKHNYQTVNLNFQLADKEIFQSLETFLKWFCMEVTQQLKLGDRLADFWDNNLTSKSNCTNYFEEYLLAEIDNALVLGLDEIERVFEQEQIYQEFLSLLRYWYEYNTMETSELWDKLRLLIVHSTEVYIPLDINQSPFNVGLPIELPYLNQSQIQELAERYGLNWHSEQVNKLWELVEGHPFLLNLALYHIAYQNKTLEELLETATTKQGIFYNSYLKKYELILEDYPELSQIMKQVIKSDEIVKIPSDLAFQLYSIGLVKHSGNKIVTSLKLYRKYFGENLQ